MQYNKCNKVGPVYCENSNPLLILVKILPLLINTITRTEEHFGAQRLFFHSLGSITEFSFISI